MVWPTRHLAIGAGLVLLLTPAAPNAVAAAAAGAPAPVPSAQPLLITRAQLGPGWTSSDPPPARVPALSCHPLPLRLQSQHRTAVAAATFAQGSAGPFVQQTAYRWASAATATAIWRQVARRSLLSCLAESLTRGGASGVRFIVTGRHSLAAPRLSVGVRAYRVTATASIGGQDFPAFLDELVLNTGGAVSEISIATYEQPPSAAVEARVARLVAVRGVAAARVMHSRNGR